MSDKITVYRIYKGELIGAEVRETKSMYIFTGERPCAFGCLKGIYKGEALFSPQEAIQAHRNFLVTSVGIMKDKLKSNYDALESLRQLES